MCEQTVAKLAGSQIAFAVPRELQRELLSEKHNSRLHQPSTLAMGNDTLRQAQLHILHRVLLVTGNAAA